MFGQPATKNDADAIVGKRFVLVKGGASALRSIRSALMELAYELARFPDREAYLVLPDVKVTESRLRQEWELAKSVLQPDLLARLSICVEEGGRYVGIPRNPDPETERILNGRVHQESQNKSVGLPRPEAPSVVFKILFLHWLTDGSPVTTRWLESVAGFSYPTIAKALRPLRGYIERLSNRSIRLRWFPREEYLRLIAMSNRLRSTIRYADRSGRPRSLESHLKRLEKLALNDVAIGGVLGAKHYFPNLDLVGLPRLDLSVHCPGKFMDLSFISRLDPALKRVDDPFEPASLVVHAVRHVDSFFAPRDGGLAWADPVDCLLDLHEARLEMQASQFLENLLNKIKTRNSSEQEQA